MEASGEGLHQQKHHCTFSSMELDSIFNFSFGRAQKIKQVVFCTNKVGCYKYVLDT